MRGSELLLSPAAYPRIIESMTYGKNSPIPFLCQWDIQASPVFDAMRRSDHSGSVVDNDAIKATAIIIRTFLNA